ncbi:hypothetical protein AMJ49_01920 [Parcubacteria bacterium DG_74_2]|nr:MAG: hypothetical protein AMJ49_01920 [Parcubacteria bacterium DG_74_2]
MSKNRKIILIVIASLLLIGSVYQVFFRKKETPFTLVEVSQGIVSQEISETGQIKKGEEIKLSFKNAGRIKEIYVEIGEEIKSGEKLAQLDDTSLLIDLQTSKSGLKLAQAKLDKLLTGPSSEEIKIAETQVTNSQISLAIAQENLNQAYEDAQNSLDDYYLKIYNAFNVVNSIQRSYFTGNDQEGIKVRENKSKIENALIRTKLYLDIAKADPKNENIDVALSEMKKALENTFNALSVIRENCETATYQNLVSSADKTSLDNQRTYINTTLTNITNSQQTISSMKLSLEAAEGQLQATKDNLALVTAKPRQEDIDLYESQVDQAQAQVRLLENQLEDAILRSPIDGQVIKINKKIGEQVQPMVQDVVISLLSDNPFQIKTDIYEEDIVKIKVGNPVDISLVSFPGQIFKGKIISIDPAEKLKEGVVYYEINIDFEDAPEGVKPGMSADLVIKTASKENVLIIPEKAIRKKDDRIIVQILRNRAVEEREIEVGLRGNDMVEIISGLKEGDKIILSSQ